MKYVKLDAVTKIISTNSMKAAAQWDIDAVVCCGEIMREIEALPEGDYVELSQTEKD